MPWALSQLTTGSNRHNSDPRVALAQDKRRHTGTLTSRGSHAGLVWGGFSLVLLCLIPRFLFCWQDIKFYTSAASCLPQALLMPRRHLPPSVWGQWGRVPLAMPCRLQQRQLQLHGLQAAGKGRRSPVGVSALSACPRTLLLGSRMGRMPPMPRSFPASWPLGHTHPLSTSPSLRS